MKKYTTFSVALISAMLVLCTSPEVTLAAPWSTVHFFAPWSTVRRVVRVKRMIKPRPYEDAISKVARKNNVPADLVHAVVRTESNYNARARGSVGEIGLMQLRLSTARSLGYSGSVKGLYNPYINLEYGTKYLAIAHRLSYGSTCGTILKYNAGHGARRMNPISARYCRKVKAYLASVR